MEKTKENRSLTCEEMSYLYHDVLSIKEVLENYSSQAKKIKVLAKNDEWCFPAYAVEDTVITRGIGLHNLEL